MKIILMLVLYLMSITCLAKPTWFRFKQNGLYGFKNVSGQMIVPAQYQMAEDPVNGIAAVMENHKWFYINKNGKRLVTPYIYDNGPDYFVEELSRFIFNNKIGFIDKNGRIIIKARFDFVTPFKKGYATYCMGCKSIRVRDDNGNYGDYHMMQGGKWGCINKRGNIVSADYCEPRFTRIANPTS